MKRLSESIFNAGIKRNQGEEVKKEDNVNFLEKDDFYEYLKKRYQQIGKFDIDNWYANFIGFPVEMSELNSAHIIYLCYDRQDNPDIIQSSSNFLDNYPELYELLKNKARIEIEKKYHIKNKILHTIVLYPKEGKATNTFFLTIIDTILNNIDKPLFKKI